MFRDTSGLLRWIELAKIAKQESIAVRLVMKIERWFRNATEAGPLSKWSALRRETCALMLAGVVRIHAQLTL